MKLPSIKNASIAKGSTVLVRVDLNVPIEDGKVRDDYRIRHVLRTVEFLREAGAQIILMSHCKGAPDNSLRTVAEYISEEFFPISFVGETIGPAVNEMVSMIGPGDVLLIENLRLHEEEEGNDDGFSAGLAELADTYVNEAFSVSHRRHASIVGVPRHLPSYAGFRLQEEVENLEAAIAPPAPFVFCLGGAKFDTKMPLIRKFAARADTVFVGGALVNDLFKAQGFEVGTSLVSHADYACEELLKRDNLLLPSDVITTDGSIKAPDDVAADEAIMDAGPQTVKEVGKRVKGAAFIVWNGPLGDYEHGYTDGTLGLAKAVGQSDTHSVVGGGDTLAAIEELNILDQFTFVSTGGGAMLAYLAREDLPGLQALRDNDLV